MRLAFARMRQIGFWGLGDSRQHGDHCFLWIWLLGISGLGGDVVVCVSMVFGRIGPGFRVDGY